jgi:hypothetical protein
VAKATAALYVDYYKNKKIGCYLSNIIKINVLRTEFHNIYTLVLIFTYIVLYDVLCDVLYDVLCDVLCDVLYDVLNRSKIKLCNV